MSDETLTPTARAARTQLLNLEGERAQLTDEIARHTARIVVIDILSAAVEPLANPAPAPAAS